MQLSQAFVVLDDPHVAEVQDLVAALTRVAALSVEDRWPWLATVPDLARHPDVSVRVAVLAALRGCRGLQAIQAVAAGLADGEAEVRRAALAAVGAVADAEQGLLLTAMTSPHDEIRRGAVGMGAHSSIQIWIRALAEPALADLVVDELCRQGNSLLLQGALLQHRDQGHIDDDRVLRILTAHPWFLKLGEINRWVPRQPLNPSVLPTPETVHGVVRSAKPPHALERSLAVLARAGEDACVAALDKVVEKALQRQLNIVDVHALGLAVLLNLLRDRLVPPPTQLVLALLLAPGLLAMDELPAAAGRLALRRFQQLEQANRLPSKGIEDALLAWVWDEDRLDLAALAGLQRLYDLMPLYLLAKGERRDDLMRALASHPDVAVTLLLAMQEAEHQVVATLLVDGAVAHGHLMVPALGIVLARVPAMRDLLVRRISPDSLLAAALIFADRHPDTTTADGEALAAALCDKGRRVDLLLRELLLAVDRPGPVLVPLLRQRVITAKPRTFVARLGEDGCTALARLDSEHPMLVGTLAARVAKAMPPGWSDPVLVAWRAPLQPAPPDPMLEVPDEAPPRVVDKTKAFRLRTCRTEALDKVVEFALASRSTGLAELLLGRRPPEQPLPRVCLAAVLSDDPPAADALVLARFGAEDPDVARVVGRILVARYQRRSLSLPAAAWLCRWDEARALLQAHVDAWEGGLPALLAESLGWQGPALRGVFWQAGARLVQQWQAREPGRLRGTAGAALAAVAAEALTDRSGGGRGLLGYPASSRDLATVQGAAARILVDLRACGVDVSAHEAAVRAVLPILDRAARLWLCPWLVSALPPPVPRDEAPVRVDVVALAELVEEATDEPALRAALSADERGAVALAAETLAGRGPGGRALLRQALAQDPLVWPREVFTALLPFAGEVTQADGDGATWPAGRSFLRVARALSLPEGAEREAAIDAALDAAAQVPDDTLGIDPAPLIGLGLKPARIAERLVHARHPTLWQWAARALCKAPVSHLETLLAFLDARGTDEPIVSWEVASAVARFRPERVWPWLCQGLMTNETTFQEWGSKVDAHLLRRLIQAVLVGGAVAVPDNVVVLRIQWLRVHRSPSLWEPAAVAALRWNRDAQAVAPLVPALAASAGHFHGTRRVAEVFRWGRLQGLMLLGKRYQVHTTTRGLGWTRLNERKVFVNPTPLLRGERDGEALLRGLVVHELGHHRYNTDADGLAANQVATQEGIFRLLNLVQDEHLERNLRSLDEDWGNDLKKLAAWAFQHAQRSEVVATLDRSLGPHLVPVLRHAGISPARERQSVVVQTGALLGALERNGSEFAAFVRALRMGRGARAAPPRVRQALALFDALPDGRPFREATNTELLQTARQLREIFGDQSDQLESFDLHGTADGDEGDDLADGRGVTDDDVQREVVRLDKVEERSQPEGSDGAPKRGGADVLVTGPDADFKRITEVRVLAHDPDAAAALAAEVARPARLLREDLAHLGLSTRVVKPRVAGHRLDRSRLPGLALRRDPRVLQRRTRVIDSDLFVGIVVDCSGSMHGARIHRARHMAAVVAEAVRPLDGVDARVFGFTDRIIWDAGSDRRCSAHALEANGGNNDAAGLYHAAQAALASPRSAKLLVMISDGLPTECTTTALKTLVKSLQRRYGMVCAQVAVHSLHEQCFDHYIEVLSDDVDVSVRQFGRVVSRLVRATLTG
ncbi:MAG: HEAT repeat domain-containing protein [Alphaproteobacteria bacterium]|nr:HEAT repeat domain-containing protein [Alphaproteobacteria bacterium]